MSYDPAYIKWQQRYDAMVPDGPEDDEDYDPDDENGYYEDDMPEDEA